MFLVGLSEYAAAFFANRVRFSRVQALGRYRSDAGVFMHLIVPRKEPTQVCLSILDAAEGFGKRVTVFQRFELGFGIWIIIGGVGP